VKSPIRAFYIDKSAHTSLRPKFYKFVGRGGAMLRTTMYQVWLLGRQFTVFIRIGGKK